MSRPQPNRAPKTRCVESNRASPPRVKSDRNPNIRGANPKISWSGPTMSILRRTGHRRSRTRDQPTGGISGRLAIGVVFCGLSAYRQVNLAPSASTVRETLLVAMPNSSCIPTRFANLDVIQIHRSSTIPNCRKLRVLPDFDGSAGGVSTVVGRVANSNQSLEEVS